MTETEQEKTVTNTEKLKESAAEVVDALGLVCQGKRNLVCGDIPQACNQLQEACGLLAKKYGETAEECGEAYLCYGKALLEMSRMESGVLGNALQGIEEDDTEDEKSEASADKLDEEKMTEEEKEKLSNEVIDAMVEREEEVKKKSKENGCSEVDRAEVCKEATKETNGKLNVENGTEKIEAQAVKGNEKIETEIKDKKPDESEQKQDEKAQNGVDATPLNSEEAVEKDKVNGAKEEKDNGETEEMDTDDKKGDETAEGESEELNTEEEEGTGTEEEEGTGTEEEEKVNISQEDVSNLQVSWEILELAKLIYKKNDTRESKLKLAECHLKLGEVGLETEQYDQAIEDFKQCLTLRIEVMEPEDRCLAETYYQLGCAFVYAGKYEDAVENCQKAASVIETKIERLNKVIEQAEENSKGKEPQSDNPVTKARKEVEELKDVLPDILTKIDDIKEEKKTAEVAKQMVKDTVSASLGINTNAFGEPSDQTVTSQEVESKPADITHLVRKKRKPEDESSKESKETEAKKSKTDESGDAPKVNGDG